MNKHELIARLNKLSPSERPRAVRAIAQAGGTIFGRCFAIWDSPEFRHIVDEPNTYTYSDSCIILDAMVIAALEGRLVDVPEHVEHFVFCYWLACIPDNDSMNEKINEYTTKAPSGARN